ncbi:MAG TPA: efflux RND transporter permease subunit [Polyangiales bacterium]|nr:efflux RND transporter permease subunit [Polyangiales bacterium]
MWLVSIALRRPYTFVIMGLLIVLLGVTTISRMSTDILPEIDIPVVAVVWQYGGLTPEEMEKRIVSGFERFLTTTVGGIEHTESQSLTGVAVIKAFFHPNASVDAATAQIAAVSQTTLRSLPPGATPPLILRYSASNAPVLQVALESEKLSEQQLFDYGVNFVRAGLATVQGAGTPYPYGGKQRQVMVDLDLTKLYAWGLSPRDVINALGVQNLTLPTGSIKLGAREYPVIANSSPDSLEELSRIPLRTVNGKTVFLSDVASVRDGFAPQTSLVHANGKRAVVMPILKSAGTSTLDVVSRVRAALPDILATLPKELKVTPLFDQSVFVRAAVADVVHEAVIAAGLTALMMLVFLGSWRSTLIVVVSIPLSILAGTIALYWCGQTLNLMTLGGMSLAVGILVDDATVELENIHRNLAQGKPATRAILDGAHEIAVPAFVSTLCICIVFLPIAFITGPARSLFLPLAMAVAFSMAVSYFLSRTLVPTLVRYLLAAEKHGNGAERSRFHAAFERGFERLRSSYGRVLAGALARPLSVITGFLIFVGLSVALFPLVGRDFFPSVDAGLIRLHVRAPPGTRIEATEQLYIAVGESIRDVIPGDEIETLINNIGVTSSPINLSMSDGTLISSADGEILIALKPGHGSSQEYVRQLRATLPERHPALTFFFLAPDISTQVLNFGTSAPVDIQVTGPPPTVRQNLAIAAEIERAVSRIPGIVDVRMQQVTNTPQLRVDVDRSAAAQVGLSQRDVAGDMLISLSSSGQTSPNFWLDPKKGIQYNVAVQTPQYRLDSLEALAATPIGAATGATAVPQILTNVAKFQRSSGATNITHHNAMPTYDVLANVDGNDLGSVARAIEEVLEPLRAKLPRGSSIRLRGQVESMESSFRGLGYGLILAIVLVYCVMVVNFQSWLDPFVILMALPGALAGIAWILFLSQTTLSVPALMGTIMCIGVATANSILLVSFANDYRREARSDEERTALRAALAAGTTRLRPVLMTALAMVAGMLPMSLGLGDAGEQNAPLGRAVIGGLVLATLSTLLFVPVVYSVLRRKQPAPNEEIEPQSLPAAEGEYG